jgi:hypothetical protein
LPGWVWNYAVVQVTQPGIESIGYKYFIVWAVLNFTWFWVVYCKCLRPLDGLIYLKPPPLLVPGTAADFSLAVFYPETARKTLEELDFIFMKPGDRPQTVEGEFLEKDEKNPALTLTKPISSASGKWDASEAV